MFRVVRNVSMIVIGLLFFNLIVYGPIETFKNLRTTKADFYAIPFAPTFFTTFLGRTLLQGMGMTVGWSLVGLGSTFMTAGPAAIQTNKGKEMPKTALDEKIEGFYDRILDSLVAANEVL